MLQEKYLFYVVQKLKFVCINFTNFCRDGAPQKTPRSVKGIVNLFTCDSQGRRSPGGPKGGPGTPNF